MLTFFLDWTTICSSVVSTISVGGASGGGSSSSSGSRGASLCYIPDNLNFIFDGSILGFGFSSSFMKV